MSAAGHRMRNEDEHPIPHRKSSGLSPELDEVLHMLKALEDGPEDDDIDAPPPGHSQ